MWGNFYGVFSWSRKCPQCENNTLITLIIIPELQWKHENYTHASSPIHVFTKFFPVKIIKFTITSLYSWNFNLMIATSICGIISLVSCYFYDSCINAHEIPSKCMAYAKCKTYRNSLFASVWNTVVHSGKQCQYKANIALPYILTSIHPSSLQCQ